MRYNRACRKCGHMWNTLFATVEHHTGCVKCKAQAKSEPAVRPQLAEGRPLPMATTEQQRKALELTAELNKAFGR